MLASKTTVKKGSSIPSGSLDRVGKAGASRRCNTFVPVRVQLLVGLWTRHLTRPDVCVFGRGEAQ